jgi:adenylate kinase
MLEAEKTKNFNSTRKIEDEGEADKDNQDKEPSEKYSDDDDVDRA